MIGPIEAIEVIAALLLVVTAGFVGHTYAAGTHLWAGHRDRTPLTAPRDQQQEEGVRALTVADRPPVPTPRHRLADAVTGSFSATAVLLRLKAEEAAAPPLPRAGRRRLDADAP